MSHLSVSQILNRFSSWGEFCSAAGGWHKPYMELDNGQSINARAFEKKRKRKDVPPKGYREKEIKQFLSDSIAKVTAIVEKYPDLDMDKKNAELEALQVSLCSFFSLPELTAQVKSLHIPIAKGASRPALSRSWTEHHVTRMQKDAAVAASSATPSATRSIVLQNCSLVRLLSYYLSPEDLARADGVSHVFHHVVSDNHPRRSPWSRVTISVSGYSQLNRLQCHYMQRLRLTGRYSNKEFVQMRRASHNWRELRHLDDKAKYTTKGNDGVIWAKNLRERTKRQLEDGELAGDEPPPDWQPKSKPAEAVRADAAAVPMQEEPEAEAKEEEAEQDDEAEERPKKKQRK